VCVCVCVCVCARNLSLLQLCVWSFQGTLLFLALFLNCSNGCGCAFVFLFQPDTAQSSILSLTVSMFVVASSHVTPRAAAMSAWSEFKHKLAMPSKSHHSQACPSWSTAALQPSPSHQATLWQQWTTSWDSKRESYPWFKNVWSRVRWQAQDSNGSQCYCRELVCSGWWGGKLSCVVPGDNWPPYWQRGGKTTKCFHHCWHGDAATLRDCSRVANFGSMERCKYYLGSFEGPFWREGNLWRRDIFILSDPVLLCLCCTYVNNIWFYQ
jgi:hypothetical protein